MFWSILEKFYTLKNAILPNNHFYEILDLFNLFLRPNIIKILEFLKEKKINKICDKVMIYTNNQGPKSWTHLIKSYFHHKLDYPLFDKSIGAFKVNGKQIEVCRTSYSKSVSDLINCTKLPANTKFCFIDDQHHPDMEHKNVIYLNVKQYVYNYKFSHMIETYFNKFSKKILKVTTKQNYIDYFKHHSQGYKYDKLHKSDLEQDVDNVIGKKIIEHLERFFKAKKTDKKSRKKYKLKFNYTRRNKNQ